MKWKDFFEERILERGYDYYRSGAVRELNVEEEEITAAVDGTEEYDVSILLENGAIDTMECDCPYAADGNNCKHMAAVLYAAEHAPVTAKRSASELEAFIEQVDISDLKKFLVEVLQKDHGLFLKLKSSLVRNAEEFDMQLYQKQIDRTIRKYEGYDGFIEYGDAGGFMDEMLAFLDEDVQNMIDHQLYSSAFALSSYLFLRVSAVEMDDSNGELGEFGCRCCEVWNEILSKADKAVEEEIYLWMIDHLDGSVVDYMEEYLEDMLMKEFQTQVYLRKKLLYTEQRAAQIPYSDNWSGQYEREKWARHHILIMEQLHTDDNAILAYCRKYREHSKIRNYCVRLWLERGNLAEAIYLLEESLKPDESRPGLIAEHLCQLKELYKKTGNQERYHSCLRQLVVKRAAIEDFRELKSLYSEDEWLSVRESIFSDVSGYYAAVLYAEEGLFDRLLDYVMKQYGIRELQQYEAILAEHYPEQVLNKYHDYLMKAAEHTADRKTYQDWAAILRQMLSVQGGAACVRQIIEEWRNLYPRRKAMMQEIDKIKI